RSVGAARPGGAAPAPRALRVGPNSDLADADRVLLLVDLDAVAEHQAVCDGVAVRHPSVAVRPGGPALRAEELLVHVRAVVLPPVDARDDREARADAARTLGETEALPGGGDRPLRRHHEPLADVRRRDRARMRKARDPDDAVLAQVDAHASERAGVVRDVGVDRVEDSGHAVVERAGPRLVEPGWEAVDVVGQVGLDHPGIRVDRDAYLDRNTVGCRSERIVHAFADDR